MGKIDLFHAQKVRLSVSDRIPTVFVVESPKGLSSIGNSRHFSTELNILILCGTMAALAIIPSWANITLRCASHRSREVRSCINSIQEVIANSAMRIVFSDENFNIISYRLYRRVLVKCERSKVITILSTRKRIYSTIHNPLLYIYCAPLLLKVGLGLRLRYTELNGVTVYTAPIKYDVIEDTSDQVIEPLIRITDARLLILLPLINVPIEGIPNLIDIHRRYFEYINMVLDNIAETCGLKAIKTVYMKTHPRSDGSEWNYINAQFIQAANVLDASVPIEFYGYSDCLVINLESSFVEHKSKGNRILLYASAFGYPMNLIAGMTGELLSSITDGTEIVLNRYNE